MTVIFVLRTRHDNKIANVPLFCGLNPCCSRAESGDGLDIPCSPLYGLKVMIDCSPGSLAGSFDDLCLYFTLCSPLPEKCGHQGKQRVFEWFWVWNATGNCCSWSAAWAKGQRWASCHPGRPATRANEQAHPLSASAALKYIRVIAATIWKQRKYESVSRFNTWKVLMEKINYVQSKHGHVFMERNTQKRNLV